ncbi:hypothetical protein [Photobacterium sanguinicancri]|uniref:hypothetical protein n=1 Tax=Photobacterium sanguinicancri TaxID=875932 RepID=UPI0026E4467B|nr:hypothetical protein [Photobacterium sanguinicancri]MDO6499084.1 hypothetical protein [Photobacterium sanguinicancri]
MPMNQHTEEAPLWVLPLAILVILALQLATNFDDAQHQKINTLHGETLQLWQASEGVNNVDLRSKGIARDHTVMS